jgi:hypothetical protein
MSQETEVISCPACRHLVRIPADWLGQTVQCPECKARFTAPARIDGKLGDAVLLDAPQPDAKPLPPRPDGSLWMPAFALMLLGVASLIANGHTLYSMATSRDEHLRMIQANAAGAAEQMGQDPGAVQAEVSVPRVMGAAIWGTICGGSSFAAGVCIVLRRGWWIARTGSVLAFLNLPGLCCVPGAFAGGFAWAMLGTEEGRAHFSR